MEDDNKLSEEFSLDLRDPEELMDILQEDPYAITFGDIFDSDYLAEKSEYSSLNQFVNDLPPEIEFGVELAEVPMVASLSSDDPTEQELLDKHVANNTSFEDWEDMKEDGMKQMMSKGASGRLEVKQ